MTIYLLRALTATRIVKGKFKLVAADGRARHHYAFGEYIAEFCKGQRLEVIPLPNSSSWVVTGNAVLGEVVLDGTSEDVDYEVMGTELTIPG